MVRHSKFQAPNLLLQIVKAYGTILGMKNITNSKQIELKKELPDSYADITCEKAFVRTDGKIKKCKEIIESKAVGKHRCTCLGKYQGVLPDYVSIEE